MKILFLLFLLSSVLLSLENKTLLKLPIKIKNSINIKKININILLNEMNRKHNNNIGTIFLHLVPVIEHKQNSYYFVFNKNNYILDKRNLNKQLPILKIKVYNISKKDFKNYKSPFQKLLKKNISSSTPITFIGILKTIIERSYIFKIKSNYKIEIIIEDLCYKKKYCKGKNFHREIAPINSKITKKANSKDIKKDTQKNQKIDTKSVISKIYLKSAKNTQKISTKNKPIDKIKQTKKKRKKQVFIYKVKNFKDCEKCKFKIKLNNKIYTLKESIKTDRKITKCKTLDNQHSCTVKNRKILLLDRYKIIGIKGIIKAYTQNNKYKLKRNYIILDLNTFPTEKVFVYKQKEYTVELNKEKREVSFKDITLIIDNKDLKALNRYYSDNITINGQSIKELYLLKDRRICEINNKDLKCDIIKNIIEVSIKINTNNPKILSNYLKIEPNNLFIRLFQYEKLKKNDRFQCYNVNKSDGYIKFTKENLKVDISDLDYFRYEKYYLLYFYKSREECLNDSKYKSKVSIKETFKDNISEKTICKEYLWVKSRNLNECIKGVMKNNKIIYKPKLKKITRLIIVENSNGFASTKIVDMKIKSLINSNTKVIILNDDGTYFITDENLSKLNFSMNSEEFSPFLYLNNLNKVVNKDIKEIYYFSAKTVYKEPNKNFGNILKWKINKIRVTVWSYSPEIFNYYVTSSFNLSELKK